MAPRKVTIVGSGNWGSAVATVIGVTTTKFPTEFDSMVKMWVFEEMVDGRKLTEIINTEHENVKYLPGKKLPTNVVAVPDLIEACKDADVLIFVIPHQFIENVCKQLVGKLKADAIAVTLVKGLLARKEGHKLFLVSEEIKELLGIPVSVLMGANLAGEVANQNFCEATIGCTGDRPMRHMLKRLFQTENFRINIVKDAQTVELCGALKNIVACAAGLSDGLGYGDNTKAAVIRLGLMEMTKFVEHFYRGSNLMTFFESSGVADLITSCYGGRNRKLLCAFVKSDKSIRELEKELLGGQSAQGPLTAEEVAVMLKHYNLEDRFPIFVAVNQIIKREMKAEDLINVLRHHPEHA